MIPASDGVKVPARIYRPKDMRAAERRGVLFVHGAGYLHNVTTIGRRIRASTCSTSISRPRDTSCWIIDYRGSAGYGRDWRTAIYRWMGGRDLQDEVDGSKYLTKEFGSIPSGSACTAAVTADS